MIYKRKYPHEKTVIIAEFKGDICVSPLTNIETKETTKISFTNLDKEYEPGYEFENTGKLFQVKDPTIIFKFRSPKSVDVVIEALNEIKKYLESNDR